MKDLYLLIDKLSEKDKEKFRRTLTYKQRAFFDAILEEVKDKHYPKFAHYVQVLYNMTSRHSEFRKNYQALFAIKRGLMNKLNAYFSQLPKKDVNLPEVSEAWRCYLWARHYYEKMEWEAAQLWIKKALYHAQKENLMSLYIDAKTLYYFLIDIEDTPPTLKEIQSDYQVILKNYVIRFATWIMNVYNPYAYAQEKSTRILKEILENFYKSIEGFKDSPEIMEWVKFIKYLIRYYDEVLFPDNPNVNDEVIDEILTYLEEFLVEKEKYKLFPVPQKLTKDIIWDMLMIYRYRQGYIEDVYKQVVGRLRQIDTKHPYYERISMLYTMCSIASGKFKELKKYSRFLIKKGIYVEHAIYHYYVSSLFLGEWSEEEEIDLINFINQDKVIYGSYGRQLRLRNQSLFFFHKKDAEGINVVIKTYRNSSYAHQRINAIYDFCVIIYYALGILTNPRKRTRAKYEKLKEAVEKYMVFPRHTRWIRNHHVLFIKKNIFPILERFKYLEDDKSRSKETD